ncbi:hypothetical protein BC941DRAFT_423170 [Chlamydoabsidia padenii]|nr:hypothetical protein BC941DRAFT_423170 [Chlamydoabsidia padenii]
MVPNTTTMTTAATTTTDITNTTSDNAYWMNTSMDPITQLSLYKLYQQENALEEPVLRKKVLIRNTLLTACMITMEQEKQKEQSWLDACFDQLDEDMEDSTDDTSQPIDSTPFLFQPTTKESSPSSSSSSHTLLLAIPSEHDKVLALLDWSWSTSTLLSPTLPS